jgi:fatty-acyl-CoA synthase
MREGHRRRDGAPRTLDVEHHPRSDRVYITGRAKDVIIRGAHNIDPAVIEVALLSHPDVAVAAAVGQPDSYTGELPVAFVSLKPGAMITSDALLAYVAPLMPEPAACPKQISVLHELPLTPVGKIYKPALRLLATEQCSG